VKKRSGDGPLHRINFPIMQDRLIEN